MFVKFSKCSVIGASDPVAGRTASRRKLGSFEYDDRGTGFLYVSVRACTADVPNLNRDMLPHSELKTAYRTFVGKPVYVNHANTNLDRARGFIIDAVYHDEDPADRWIEILMEMDEVTFPTLCGLIRSGDIDTVSMGLNCEATTCSVCGNVAEQPSEFCEHIRQKGRTFGGVLAYEICNKIAFFEESWVYDPADPTATVQALECEAKTAKTAQLDDDEGETFTVYVFKSKIDFDGDAINSFYDDGDDEVIGEYQTLEEAKAMADGVDPNEYIDVVSAGPLKAAVSSVSVAVLAEDGDDLYDGPSSDDTMKAPYDARDELVEAVTDGLPGDPSVDLSFAPGSWETFYVQWRGLDISEEMQDALDDAGVPDYCKVRVSNHDASSSTGFSEPTHFVWLDECRSFNDVAAQVRDAYDEWKHDIETVLGDDVSSRLAAKMDDGRTVTAASGEWVDGSYGDDSYQLEVYDEEDTAFSGTVMPEGGSWAAWMTSPDNLMTYGEEDFATKEEAMRYVEEQARSEGFEVTADNMVNKLRIPEEVDMQNSDRVCPICGSPDFDGTYCDVCEYVEYAEGFGDIDTEQARENKEDRKAIEDGDDGESADEEMTDDIEDAYEENEKEGRTALRSFDISADRDIVLDELDGLGYADGIDYDIAGEGSTVVSHSASLNNWMDANGIGENR